ncbi:hypothetical protein ON010_g14233 [Phytophthora cinnamomi]|nr:hypothetical protein ON010_g14233 [Phytophthora cinnamomi]
MIDVVSGVSDPYCDSAVSRLGSAAAGRKTAEHTVAATAAESAAEESRSEGPPSGRSAPCFGMGGFVPATSGEAHGERGAEQEAQGPSAAEAMAGQGAAQRVVGTSIQLCRQYEVDARGVTPPTDNETVFRDLLLGMDEMYAGVDDFFEKVKMDELPCPGRRNTTPGSRAEGKFVELLDSYAVPFGLDDTEKAVWRCLGEEEPQSPKPAFVQVFDECDNTLKQSMCSAFTAGNVHVRVIMRKVGRKYVEQDRGVFIFRRLIEPVAGVPIAFQETTRLIVQPGPPSDLGPTTVIQSHRQSTANHDAYSLAARRVPRAFIDMGVAAWEDSITRFNYFVEDTLIRAH